MNEENDRNGREDSMDRRKESRAADADPMNSIRQTTKAEESSSSNTIENIPDSRTIETESRQITPIMKEMQYPNDPKTEKMRKKNGSKVIVGCFGAIIGFVILVIFALTLVMSQAGSENNPILQIFGMDAMNLNRLLVQITNIVFGTIVFLSFLVTIIGIFRLGMSKKDDKRSRTKGLLQTVMGAILFATVIFLWITIYLYLREKIPSVPVGRVEIIQTIPAVTLGLTAPMDITFDAAGAPLKDDQYQILSYEWNFGDGTRPMTGKVVQHTFTRKGPDAGRYVVSVTVTYQNKKDGTLEKVAFDKDVVFDNEKVSALFSVSDEKGEAPMTVRFDASGSIDPDGEIIKYDWDFNEDNDYSDAEGIKVAHTFENVGDYRASLRVTDSNGEYDLFEKKIEVTAPVKIGASISHSGDDDTLIAGKQYTFDGIGSNSPNGIIESYLWDFGDGSKNAKTRTVNHEYKETGKYELRLKVTDEIGESAEQSLEIIVKKAEEAPKPVLKTTPPYAKSADGALTLRGTVPLLVKFDASESMDADDGIVDYQWDFNGDEKIDDIGESVEYTFETVGEFDVSLFVIDAKNNQSTQKMVVITEEQGLLAKIKASAIEGITPLTVNFDASASSYPEGEIVSYDWRFGDDTPTRLSGATISHIYEKIGTFKMQVTVIASDGKRAEASMDINVRPIPLTACFEANIEKGPSPLTVTFNPNCSKGSIRTYIWDFGGETSRETRPTKTFDNPGEYEVTLKVADNENVVDSYSKIISVTEK